MIRRTAFFAGALVVAGCSPEFQHELPGAIFATGASGNVFAERADVVIEGGSAPDGSGRLPNGDYVLAVTDASGRELLGDALEVEVSGGNLSPIALPKFSFSDNGVYKVWITRASDFGGGPGGFHPLKSRTDTFRVLEKCRQDDGNDEGEDEEDECEDERDDDDRDDPEDPRDPEDPSDPEDPRDPEDPNEDPEDPPGDVDENGCDDVYGVRYGDHYGDQIGDTWGDHYGDWYGDMFGNQHGDQIGDIYGDIQGNIYGDVYGDWYGDLYGNHYGSHYGDRYGDTFGSTGLPNECQQ